MAVKNILFPEDTPVCTPEGLEPPKGRHIGITDAKEYGLSLEEWGFLFFAGIRFVGCDKRIVNQYRNFYCGSESTYYRTLRKLRERGLVA